MQTTTSTGFVSLQYAYNLLQRGLERYHSTGELFSEEELATLAYFQEKMVLSETETQLISKSRASLEQHQKQQKWLIASALLFTLALLLTPGWKWLLSEQNLSQTTRLEQANIGEMSASLPVNAKINVGPGIQKAEKAAATMPATPGQPTEKAAPPTLSAAERPSSKPYDEEIPSGRVVLVRKGEKWGIVDRQKRQVLLPIRYDAIRPFSQDGELLQIKSNDLRGIVTADGTILLHPYFDKFPAYYAEEELIIVVNQGKYGVYSRKDSNFIIDFKYEQICCYSEGLFGVKTSSEEWSFVDRKGQRAIDATFDAIEKPFADNRALVREGDSQYYIDKSGRKLSSWP